MILTLLAVMGAALSNPMPPPAPKADPCAVAGACRHVNDFSLRRPDGGVDTFKAGFDAPWIINGKITLFPGEMVVVRLDESGDGLPGLVLVRGGDTKDMDIEGVAQAFRDAGEPDKEKVIGINIKPDAPPLEAGTIRFSFLQSRTTGDMLLMVEDATGKVLDYKAMMTRSGAEDAEATTVCDVSANKTAFEQWPYPIGMIELSRLRYLDPAPPAMQCD